MLPVYRNLFTNPRLVGDGTWAEVRRNLIISPLFSASLTNWQKGAAVTTLTPTATGVTAVGAPAVTGASIISATASAVITVAAGEVISTGFWVTNNAATSVTLAAENWYPGVSSSSGPSVVIPSGATMLVAYEGATVPAGATQLRVILRSVPAQSIDIHIQDNPITVKSATLGGPGFNGSSPQGSIDPDMRQRWLGTANASESVMEIERVAGLTAARCIAGVSTRDGKPAVRLIPTATSGNACVALIAIPTAARSGGTLLGTIHRPSGTAGGTYAFQLGTSQPFETIPAAPVGSTEMRRQFGALVSEYSGLFYGGSPVVGSGDVWWTDIGLFAGMYDGPAFAGDSGTIIIDGQPYDTSWAGVPGSSPSLAILSEGGHSGSIYDTLYVFSTVSNSWVRWQTPAAQGQRPVTLARTTSTPSAKAYTMRVSRRIFDEVRDLYTAPY